MDLSRAIAPRMRVSLRFLLLLGCAGTAATAHQATAAGASPSGGHFVAGAGGISGSGAATTITQSSKRGIIDWKSFSVGKGNTVQFDNGSGATLNRVTGGSLSAIAGQIKATGSIYLINPNGVVVGAGGKVLTGGTFVASTRDTSNSQFMAGGSQTFSGTSNGVVVNDGAVVSQNGSVVLVGHAVTNNGTIAAANGTAVLASGNRVLMTDTSGPDGVYVAGGGGDTTNDGQVKAAAVELAAAGGNVYALAGNRTGLVQATGTKTIAGQVWLTAPDGAVDVAGKVAAADANGAGGTITAKGASLTIADKTVLNAAGKTGHGRIETSGGKVAIGKATITAGKKGNWIVDPTNLTIDSAAAGTIDAALNAGTNVTEQTTGTTASGSGKQSGGNGDIVVAAPISWTTTAQLTLSAFHDIDIDAAIMATGNGAVVLNTNNGINGTSSGGALNFLMGQGSLQIGPTGGALTINGNAYTLVHSVAELQAVGTTGNYALAANLDTSGSGTFSGPLIASFSGTFNGLGNTISNLTILGGVGCFAGNCSGLFGTIESSGAVANLGLIGGAVSVAGSVGDFAGLNNGTIANSYATGSVTGGPDGEVGGLVGFNTGTISRSYASGAVTNGGPAGALGGLVGQNNGTIVNTYATGSVTGGANSAAGGLVGVQASGASIADSYATGQTVGGSFGVGGVLGETGGSITDGYYDSTTTGTPHGTQSNGSIGLTTAELSAALPSGFLSSIWANDGNKTTPYLGSNPGPVIAGDDAGAIPTLYNLVFTPTQLQAINNNLSANYALAHNLDMTGVSGFNPIGGTFTGTFNGLGNVIINLTIDKSAGNIGLFSILGAVGTIENIGLIGGTIKGGLANVGALVGLSNGSIRSSYSTADVSGFTVGGLVGEMGGTASINDAYATGAVTAVGEGGGLVGAAEGTISNAYSTGAVSGSEVGGIAGFATAVITNVWASGQVHGTSDTGGLIGDQGLGSLTNAYWNEDRAGTLAAIGANLGGVSTQVTGLTGSQPFTLTSYVGFTASTTPGATGNAWVIVDRNGTLNNNGGAAGATMPMLAFEYSTSIVNAHQLQLMEMDPTANYTLGANIDASATKVASIATGTDVWGTAGFSPVGDYLGTFNGQGHSIAGLTINAPTTTFVGLFGLVGTTGVVKNVGLTGGSVAGETAVGQLVGSNSGLVENSSATGSVSGQSAVGGLVGDNLAGGTVETSVAHGTVNGSTGIAGGLVGSNEGTITSSSASAAISGGDQIGGLAGSNDGVISGSSASGATSGATDIGGLVGNAESGSITNSHATGAVTGTAVDAIVGGLAGENDGAISGSSATGSVTATTGASVLGTGAMIGGLVGNNTGTVTTSTSSGNVVAGTDSNGVGGLIGFSSGPVSLSSSASNVTAANAGGNIGGLIGLASGAISQSFSTGAVTATAGSFVGGLVGQSFGGGTITKSYSTSSVTGTGSSTQVGGLVGEDGAAISQSYSAGPVSGAASVGGLVGENFEATISQSYSVSSVTVGASGSAEGGLVGDSFHGTFDQTFATGAVGGGATNEVGGLIGESVGDTVTNSYWDVGTTGRSTSSGGGSAMTTAQLQHMLPTGFTSAAWGIVADKSYPYLLFQFGVGATPQVIAGKVYNDGGATSAGAGITVNALANGTAVNSALTGGTVTTGANGYYYYLVAPGTIPANGNVLTYAQYGPGSAISGLALADQSNGYPIHLDILGNTLHVETDSTTLSAVATNLVSAVGADPTAISLRSELSNLRIDAFGAFTVDGPVNPANAVIDAAGNLTIGAGGSIAATGSVTLVAGGNFVNDAGASAITVGAGNRWLVYSTNPNNDIDDGLADSFIQYGATAPINSGITSPLSYGGFTTALGAGNGFLYSASATVTLAGVTKTYDGTTGLTTSPTTFTATGGITGDTITLGGSPVGSFASANAGTGIDVTVSDLAVTATRGGVTVFGYTVAPVTDDAIGTIARKTLTATLTGTIDKTYDGTNVATLGSGNFSLSGFVGGQGATVTQTVGTYASSNAGSGIAVTTGLNPSEFDANAGTLLSNYITPVLATGTGTIGKAALTVTAAGDTLTYDGTAFSGGNGVTYSGFVDAQSSAVLGGSLSFAGSSQGAVNAGGYAITPKGLTSGNYAISFVSGTLTIDPKALTVSLTGTVDKTYDGTAAATLASGDYALSGIIGGDAVALNAPITGSYDTANAGTGKLVTVTGLGLTGAAAGNYTVAGSVSGSVGEIDRKTLTATLTGTIDKTYDGTNVATLASGNFSLSGFAGGQGATVTQTVGTYASSNAGSDIAVTTGLNPSEFDANPGTLLSNYITPVVATGTGTIGKAALTVTLTGTVGKTYDGTTAATLTSGNYVLGGVIGADVVALNDPTSGSFDTANAGTGKLVTVSGLGLTGAADGNYTVAGSVSGAIGEIDRKALTVSLSGTVEKTYDGTTAATLAGGNYVLGGVIAGDAVALNDLATASYDTADAGTGKLVTVTGLGLTGAAGGNYTVAGSVSGSVGEIDRKALTATLTGVTKTYDGTNLATLDSGNFSLGGFVGGQGATVTQTAGTYATANAGSGIAVGASLSSGEFDANAGTLLSNYILPVAATGTGTIGKAALTVTLVGIVDKTYDGTRVATLGSDDYVLSGVLGGDAVALNDPTSGRYDTANVGDGKLVTVTGLSLTGAAAGNYTVAGSVAGAIGEVDRKLLTISLIGTVEKTYDGTTAATLTGGNYLLGGVIAGDAVTVTHPTSGTYGTANAGTGELVTVSGMFLSGADAGNYAITRSTSGAVGEIDRKLLTVSLTGTVEKTYDGTTAATLTAGNYELGGLIGGDAVTLNNPTAGSYGTANAGTGELVTVSGLVLSGTAAGNYTIARSTSGAVGQIDRAALTVTLGNVSTVYDGAGFSGGGSVSFSGFVDGETSAVLGGKLAYGGASQGAVNAGSYAIDGHGLTSGNYTITYDAGTLTIDPKVITAALTGIVIKQYDGNNIAALTSGNYLLNGVIAGDMVMLNDPAKGTYASTAVGTGIAVTADGLALSGTQAGNYRLASMTVTGDIGTISKAPVAPPIPVIPPFITVIPPLPSPAPANAEAAHSLVVPDVDLSDMAKLSGCSGEDFVAVVPEENGHVGAVVVESEGNKTLLHAAYAGCANSKPVMTNAQEVRNLFGGALAARPTPPAYYDLYYNSGSVTLVPNALAAFDKVFADIMRRKAAEVVVAGYTDTIGNPKLNDRLSLERAQAVSKLLVARGLAPGSVTAVGRGERDPQVPTKEQVAQEKNRRVEITVR